MQLQTIQVKENCLFYNNIIGAARVKITSLKDIQGFNNTL
jgi:hypothetical protein